MMTRLYQGIPCVRARARLSVGACVVGGLLACGAPALERLPSEAPRSYPGTCTLVGIEEVSAPIDQPTDTVALVARYRFGEGAGHSDAVGLHFEVARTRARDLRRHLAAQPTVVCRPDERSAAAPPVIELAPFEGQSGRALP
jgi:hypothetical protein